MMRCYAFYKSLGTGWVATPMIISIFRFKAARIFFLTKVSPSFYDCYCLHSANLLQNFKTTLPADTKKITWQLKSQINVLFSKI